MARRRAVVTIHPAGLGGIPSRGHRSPATTKGVLDRVFGEGDVTEDADQRCHGLAVDLTEHSLDWRSLPQRRAGRVTLSGTRHVVNLIGHLAGCEEGRISIGCWVASATFPAHTIASSRSAALMM